MANPKWFSLALSLVIFLGSGAKSIGTTSSSSILFDETLQFESTPTSILDNPLFEFAAKFYNAIDKGSKNLVVSPLSVQAAFGLLLPGLDGSGSDRAKLAKALCYEISIPELFYHEAFKNLALEFAKVKNEEFQSAMRDNVTVPMIDFITAIATKANLKEDYERQVMKYYKSTISTANKDTIPNIIDSVNRWGKDVGFDTDLISMKDFVPEENFVALLLSAIYLKTPWLIKFYESTNDRVTFHNYGLDRKPNQKIRMLQSFKVRVKYVVFSDKNHEHDEHGVRKTGTELSKLDFRMIEIPLRGNISYTIIEPLNNGNGNELRRLEEELMSQAQDPSWHNSRRLKLAFDVLNGEGSIQAERIYMPSFKIKTDELELQEPLKKIGVEVFERNLVQLTNMVQDSQDLYIQKAKQSAFIEVDEGGIKAAAITKVFYSTLSMIMNPVVIKVEHPFMFVVRHNRRPIMIGRLMSV